MSTRPNSPDRDRNRDRPTGADSPFPRAITPDREGPPDPLGDLPRVARRHARLAMRLNRADEALAPVLDELTAMLGDAPRLSQAEVIPRGSGLKRPGAIAQLSWPRLGTRVGLGIEPSLAHAIVDRLLGFERTEPEHRLQVSPVEWGVLGFVVARLLDRLAERPGALGPWDLFIDRVGPEPFRVDGLGPIVTLAWPIRVAPAAGAVRLWVPEVVVALALVDEPTPPPISVDPDDFDPAGRFGTMIVSGVAEAGRIPLPGGLASLRIDAVLPIAGAPLRGTPASPRGPVTIALGDGPRPWTVPAEPVPDSAGARLTITGPLSRSPRPQEALPVPSPIDPLTSANDTISPDEIPITLVVELGRLGLSLARVADLKPGDVLELSRSATEPVDLTSGGSLIARAELVRVDSSLGVRITRLYL